MRRPRPVPGYVMVPADECQTWFEKAMAEIGDVQRYFVEALSEGLTPAQIEAEVQALPEDDRRKETVLRSAGRHPEGFARVARSAIDSLRAACFRQPNFPKGRWFAVAPRITRRQGLRF